MGDKGSGLAGRFRRAVKAREKAHQSEDQRREQRRSEAVKARRSLFGRLSEFASETGFIEVRNDSDGVTLRFEDRYLHFAPQGPLDRVRIEFEGMGDETHELYREEQLGDRWVWSATRRRREDLKPFWDEGLEALLIRALDLPEPADDDDDDGDAGPGRDRTL